VAGAGPAGSPGERLWTDTSAVARKL